jgi:hypothetical protein
LLLAANCMLELAINAIEATIDLRRLYADEVTKEEVREKYEIIWEAW